MSQHELPPTRIRPVGRKCQGTLDAHLRDHPMKVQTNVGLDILFTTSVTSHSMHKSRSFSPNLECSLTGRTALLGAHARKEPVPHVGAIPTVLALSCLGKKWLRRLPTPPQAQTHVASNLHLILTFHSFLLARAWPLSLLIVAHDTLGCHLFLNFLPLPPHSIVLSSLLDFVPSKPFPPDGIVAFRCFYAPNTFPCKDMVNWKRTLQGMLIFVIHLVRQSERKNNYCAVVEGLWLQTDHGSPSCRW